MKDNRLKTYDLARHRSIHVIVLIVAMLSVSLHSRNVQAATLVPDDYRVSKVNGEFDDTWQYAIAFKLRPPRRLRAQYLEFATQPVRASTAWIATANSHSLMQPPRRFLVGSWRTYSG